MRPHLPIQAANAHFHYKGERTLTTRYVHCLCSSKTHSVLSNAKLIQDSFKESISQCLSHKQVAPPIIIRAYARQLSRLMPTNIPARSVNSGFPIALGGEHLKYDRFKMYIDRPRGSLSDNN